MSALYTIKRSTTFLIIFLTLSNISHLSWVNAEITSSSSLSPLTTGQEQNELQEMLKTEKHIIDTLRLYIKEQEFQLKSLKR